MQVFEKQENLLLQQLSFKCEKTFKKTVIEIEGNSSKTFCEMQENS
jgi:hypothetical protein